MSILSFFRRPKPALRPVINRYTVRKTQLQKLKDDKCRQLASELGRHWPARRGEA